jgi:hypothetical protein
VKLPLWLRNLIGRRTASLERALLDPLGLAL